jgi:hypothetical protein
MPCCFKLRTIGIAINLAALLLGLCLFGCSKEPIKQETVAHAQKLADGTYEIRLGYTEKTWGGPCNISFHSSTYHGANWLYVKSMEGELNATNVVVTTDKGMRDYPYAIKDLRGTISFAKDTMTIHLDRPSYPDGVHMEGFIAYLLNGTYQILIN